MGQPQAGRRKSEHLICGSRWALVGAVACAYFGYRVYRSIAEGADLWDHNWWNVFTWAVWAVLAAFLISEARCRRERMLFGILIVQFAIGVTFSAWGEAPSSLAHDVRWASLALWGVAALLCVVALVSNGSSGKGNAAASA